MDSRSHHTRRELIKAGLAAGIMTAAAPLLAQRAGAAGGTINFADIGVGDPDGDWSRFTKKTGYNVNLVAIGNAPSAILNVLIAGGGTTSYDIINIVGGMQKPLVDNNLVQPIDLAKLPNWNKDKNISEFLGKDMPGFKFIGYNGTVYGVPTVLQGDSFAYLPEKTGKLNSYAALFDPKWKGYVALEDNYTTAGQKTALYLKHANLAKISNPDDMTPEEFKTVVDFLIDQKKKGQFRVIWSSFEQAVDLIVNKEVYVIDCWEPMVFVAKSKELMPSMPIQGGLPAVGHGCLCDQESQSKRRADRGCLRAARLHAGGLVRRQDHDHARIYDQHRSAGLCQTARRRVPGRRGSEGGRHHRECPSQIRARAAPGRTVGRHMSMSYESEWSRFKAV